MTAIPVYVEPTPSPEVTRDSAIVQDMLRYSPCPETDHAVRAESLNAWGLTQAAGDFLLADANAFLLGCLFNYQIRYEKALSAPLELCRRLGHLDVSRLAGMNSQDLAASIAQGPHGGALHRFPNILAKRVVWASQRLRDQYDGLASNVWPDGTRVGVVLRRLQGFHGISQKISNMMVNMLVTSFGARLNNWEEIDVAVDRHVARVFLRTGLVSRVDGTYAVPDVASDTIRMARALMPRFPGHLDGVAFAIGLEWCRAERAYCDGAGEGRPCPLRATCRQRTGANLSEQGAVRIPPRCYG